MARACQPRDVDAARAQTLHMLDEAKTMIKPGSACDARLKTARVAFATADLATQNPLERRNAFVRAAFQVGQARACAVVAGIAVPVKRKRRARGPKAQSTP